MTAKNHSLLHSAVLTEQGWPTSATNMARCYYYNCNVSTKVPSPHYSINGLFRVNFCSASCKDRHISKECSLESQEKSVNQETSQEKFVNRIISAPSLNLAGNVVFEPTHAALANKRVYRLCIVCDVTFRNENNNAVQRGHKGEVTNDTKVYYDGCVVFVCSPSCTEKFDLSPWIYMEKPVSLPKKEEK